jgi:hypothetical protein
MKNKILLLVVSFLFITGVSYGGFTDLGAGGRPLGMGHAFVGIADDINAIYYNPAGLIRIRNMECTFMYAPLFLGLTDGSKISDYYGAYAQQLDVESAFGVGWLGRYLSGPGYNNAAEMLYQENMFYGSYARSLTGNLTVGVSVKVPYRQYGADQYSKTGIDDNGNVTSNKDSVFDGGYSKIGLSFDAGLLYDLTDQFSLGVMLQDFLSTNLALGTDATDQIPFNFKAGIGYRIPKFSGLEHIAIDADIAYRIGGLSNDFKFHSGAEFWFLLKTIGVRAGFGAGANSYSDFSVGGSYVFLGVPEIEIDYAWVYPLSGIVSTTSGNHRVSCVIRL